MCFSLLILFVTPIYLLISPLICGTGRLPNPLLYINICRLLDSRLPKKEEMEVPLRIFLEKQQDFQKYQGIEGTALGT